jgi:hypothetical protein
MKILLVENLSSLSPPSGLFLLVPACKLYVSRYPPFRLSLWLFSRGDLDITDRSRRAIGSVTNHCTALID